MRRWFPRGRTLDETLKLLCITGRIRRAVQLLFSSSPIASVDQSTYALLLQETIHRKEFDLGKRIHAHIILSGSTPDRYLSTKLLIFCAKLGHLDTARQLFDKIPPTDNNNKGNNNEEDEISLVAWNAIISGHVHKGLYQQALHLFYSMRVQLQRLPDHFTFASVLRACANLALLDHGRRAHCIIIKTQVKPNIVVESALVDMYSKCSCTADAHHVFLCSPEKNVVTWTALISGYGLHGNVDQVIVLFEQMTQQGFRPNAVTFLAVLSACSHGGLVDTGYKYFNSMIRDYKIKPKARHYAAMVDLMGRSGRVQEAYEFIRSLPYEKQHSVVWGALLGACRIHGHVELLRLAARKFFKMEPDNTGKYVVLSNAFAASEMWEDAADVWGKIRALGIKKDPAWSCIEVQGEVHTFHVRDKNHKRSDEVYDLLRLLIFASVESLSCDGCDLPFTARIY